MAEIKLILHVTSTTLPNLTITVNQQQVNYIAKQNNDPQGNVILLFQTELELDNSIHLIVSDADGTVDLINIIVDEMAFGWITFLCSTVNNQQSLQVINDGTIEIDLQTPIWQYWCEKMNSFNYKDYPLGSVN